jgi:tetratricopeptide (TPR) repeat protein
MAPLSLDRFQAVLRLLVSLLVTLACAQEPTSAASAPRDASKLLSAADREFGAGKYDEAIKLYAEVLNLAPTAKTYYARHKAYLKKGKLPSAVSDLTAAIELDGSYAMAYSQRGSLHLTLGRCDDAVRDLERVLALDAGKRDAQARLPHARACAAAVSRGRHLMHHGQWEGARQAFDEAMAADRATASPVLLLERARASLGLGQVEEALADGAKVLKLEPNNLAAYSLRGRALYAHGDYATARVHFQEGLKYDPEHGELKEGYKLVKAVLKAKEAGDAASQAGRWDDAIEAWASGEGIDPHNRRWQLEVLPKLARAHLRKKAYEGAERAARKAVDMDDGCAECHHLLGEALLGMQAWEEAARHARRAHELDRGNGEYQQGAQRADTALKQSKTKDYYKILEIPRDADEGAVKRAYREKAKENHPDRFMDPDKKAEAENKFKEIAEAYEVLSDGEKKGRRVKRALDVRILT